MKRHLPIVLATVVIVFAFGWLASAQPEVPGYVVSDLQLISQESKADWSVEWTGPVQAATILAWFADHGYPAFMRDFNNDGVIDELDTIELADTLGRKLMGTETVRGTTDVQLILGLAGYVAEHYPDQFVLKIYDAGFRGEFAAEESNAFDPLVVDGIELVLESDPSIAAYEVELESGEGVIVGLENGNDGNTYLSGRSFLYEETPDGYTPIDLAWAEEDFWISGHQGKVLETVGKMDGFFYLDFQSGWTQVEFMLALSPAVDPDGTSDRAGCPEDAIAYDIMVTELGDYGSVEIEECVTRVGNIDTYTYTVTNIDFLHDGCGLCLFALPKPLGMATLAHSEAIPWLYSVYPVAWVWRLPIGSCGILPGESAEFSVSVPGPTTDTSVLGVVRTCVRFGPHGTLRDDEEYFEVRSTGPGIPDQGCPDLMVRFVSQYCHCDSIEGNCALRVRFDVVNIGSEAVTDPFNVVLRSLDHLPSNIDQTYTPPPVLAPGDVWPVELMILIPMGGELCPTSYEVYVDPEFVPDGFIKECDETNNSFVGSIDCYCEESGACCFADGTCAEMPASECTEEGGLEFHPGVPCPSVQCPQPEPECPDLIVEITEMSCRNIGAVAPLYEVTIEALVTNDGGETVTQTIWVKAESACGDDTDFINTDLDPGDSATAEFTLTCTHDLGGCNDVTVTADYPNFIDECNDRNNEDTETFCCQ